MLLPAAPPNALRLSNGTVPVVPALWYCRSWASFSHSHWCWAASQRSSAWCCFSVASRSMRCFLIPNSTIRCACSAIFRACFSPAREARISASARFSSAKASWREHFPCTFKFCNVESVWLEGVEDLEAEDDQEYFLEVQGGWKSVDRSRSVDWAWRKRNSIVRSSRRWISVIHEFQLAIMVSLWRAGIGLATYLLVALCGTIHPLACNVLGLFSIEIIFEFKSAKFIVIAVPPPMDQGKCVSSKILSRLWQSCIWVEIGECSPKTMETLPKQELVRGVRALDQVEFQGGYLQ